MAIAPPSDAPRWRPLDAPQRRVIGVLIEKAKTTPGAYPMTVNAIVAGSNQKNNRDPITSYDDFDVEKALGELQELGVVKEIDWVGRVPKYKHLAYEWLGVKPVELAILAELLLRGAQALGELRSRAARMEPIEDLSALKPIVEGLLERKLMIELTPPGRGRIVSHNLYLPGEIESPQARPLAPTRSEPPAIGRVETSHSDASCRDCRSSLPDGRPGRANRTAGEPRRLLILIESPLTKP